MNNNQQGNEDFNNEVKRMCELLTELRKLIEDDTEATSEDSKNLTDANFLTSPLQIGIKLLPDGDKQKIGLMVKIDQRITASDVAVFCFHIKLATDKLMKDYVFSRVKGDDIKEITEFLKTNAARKYSNHLG